MSLDILLKKYLDPYFKDHKDNIFHYTTGDGYISIWQSMYLKLNSHHYLNKKDPSNEELSIGVNLIINELQNLDPQLCNQFQSFIKKGIIVYTVSFTTTRNIIHEKKYGDYCLEFKFELIDEYVRNPNSSPAQFSCVNYNHQEQLKLIRGMFNIYNDFINTLNNTGGDKHTLAIFKLEAEVILFTTISTIIPLLKEARHSSDKEFRMVQIEIFSPKTGKLATPAVSKKFVFSKERVRVYKSI